MFIFPSEWSGMHRQLGLHIPKRSSQVMAIEPSRQKQVHEDLHAADISFSTFFFSLVLLVQWHLSIATALSWLSKVYKVFSLNSEAAIVSLSKFVLHGGRLQSIRNKRMGLLCVLPIHELGLHTMRLTYMMKIIFKKIIKMLERGLE